MPAKKDTGFESAARALPPILTVPSALTAATLGALLADPAKSTSLPHLTSEGASRLASLPEHRRLLQSATTPYERIKVLDKIMAPAFGSGDVARNIEVVDDVTKAWMERRNWNRKNPLDRVLKSLSEATESQIGRPIQDYIRHLEGNPGKNIFSRSANRAKAFSTGYLSRVVRQMLQSAPTHNIVAAPDGKNILVGKKSLERGAISPFNYAFSRIAQLTGDSPIGTHKLMTKAKGLQRNMARPTMAIPLLYGLGQEGLGEILGYGASAAMVPGAVSELAQGAGARDLIRNIPGLEGARGFLSAAPRMALAGLKPGAPLLAMALSSYIRDTFQLDKK
jgi:hypothetical protein